MGEVTFKKIHDFGSLNDLLYESNFLYFYQILFE